jgi:hypothetical protein
MYRIDVGSRHKSTFNGSDRNGRIVPRAVGQARAQVPGFEAEQRAAL